MQATEFQNRRVSANLGSFVVPLQFKQRNSKTAEFLKIWAVLSYPCKKSIQTILSKSYLGSQRRNREQLIALEPRSNTAVSLQSRVVL